MLPDRAPGDSMIRLWDVTTGAETAHLNDNDASLWHLVP
jgi:hypothetical protein